jgi:hypothetical protein
LLALAAFSVSGVGKTPWTEEQPLARPLRIHRAAQTQNKRTQTFMPRVGFEPSILASELAKTVDALDLAVAVIGQQCQLHQEFHASEPNQTPFV